MGSGLTDDDLIDDAGFELGMPTPLECWRQQAHMLASEVGDLQRDLSNARQTVHKLVLMHSEACKERDAFMLELAKTKRDMSEHLRMGALQAAKRLVPNGSHSLSESAKGNQG